MAITKIQSESLNLADTYAFTGTVTGAGSVNTPAFVVTSPNNGFNASTFEKITFQTEVLDTDNCFDNSTNYRFTPTTAGWYYIFGRVAFDNDFATSYQIASIYKNGTEIVRGHQQLSGNYFANNNTNNQVDYIVQFNGSSDYVELYGYTTSSGAVKTAAGNSAFGGYLIKAT